MARRRKIHRAPRPHRAPLQEELLFGLLEEFSDRSFTQVLCTSVGRGQFARGVAEAWPQSQVTLHYHDLYYAGEAQRPLITYDAEQGNEPADEDDWELPEPEQAPVYSTLPINLRVVCSPDFPELEADLFAMPIRSSGDAELVRDRLQAGHQRLRIGGQFISSTDNAEDEWLHDELRKVFAKVTRRRVPEGTLYLATKTEPLKKEKNFESRFALRDQGTLVQLISRPGVFSHRRVDGGARALLKELQISDGQRLLDVGCGCGTIALAAASRGPNIEVLAVDADARAVQVTQLGAELNGLTNVRTELNCTGDAGEPGTFDIVTGNPPYFSQYHIAQLFLDTAIRALKPGGTVYMVTKTPNWYFEHMTEHFEDVAAAMGPSYAVVTGRKPGNKAKSKPKPRG